MCRRLKSFSCTFYILLLIHFFLYTYSYTLSIFIFFFIFIFISFFHSNEETITAALLLYLEKSADSGEAVDLSALTTFIAFDMVCDAAFNYQLNAVNGSEEGKKLHSCLSSMVASQAGKGIYANLSERKVSPEELKEAQSIWRTFLTKLLAVIRSDSELFRAKNGALDIEKNFGHALIQLSVTEDTYGDAQLISEIHQVRKWKTIKSKNFFLQFSFNSA